MRKSLLITSILALASSVQATELNHQTENQSKFFFGIEGGMSLFPTDKIELENKREAHVQGSKTFSGSIGYFIVPEIAIGLSLNYAPSYKVNIKHPDIPANPQLRTPKLTDIQIPITHNAWFGMVDLYYHPAINSKVLPYFIIGAGIAHINTKAADFSCVPVAANTNIPKVSEDLLKTKKFKSVKQNIFAWQVGLGTLIDINDNLKLDISAKLKAVPNYTLKATILGAELKETKMLGVINLSAGLRYQF